MSEAAASETESLFGPPGPLADLTAFQRDILWVLANDDGLKGLAVKAALEDFYGEQVNHGRLYPNLNELVDEGLIDKSERDLRTNNYELTDAAQKALADRESWQRGEHVETDGGDEIVPVHMEKYADDADLEVDYSGDEPVVTNHDELPKQREVIALKRSRVEEHGLEHNIVEPGDSLWREEFADLEIGDSFQIGEVYDA